MDAPYKQIISETRAFKVSQGLVKAARRLLPEPAHRRLQEFLAYDAKERSIYLKMKLMESLGISSPRHIRPAPTARSFLFVCFGNIMRSPMCEALMLQASVRFPDLRIKITSAGLNAVYGRPAHPWAVTAAREFGVSLDDHRARPLTGEMVDEADTIFAMDDRNRVQLRRRWPGASDKVFMLSAYAGESYRGVEIEDPYYLGEEGTRRCYAILNTCIYNLVSSHMGLLLSNPQNSEYDSSPTS